MGILVCVVTFISDAINHSGRQTVHTEDTKTRAPHRTASRSPNRNVNVECDNGAEPEKKHTCERRTPNKTGLC